MSEFFPKPPERFDESDAEDDSQPVWLSAPEDILPGVVPVELIIGRSDFAVVMLTGMRAFPNGLSMTLSARTRSRIRRFDLNREIFDWPYRHDQDDDEWQHGRLKWGFEFADGRRATNVDASPDPPPDTQPPPDVAVLSGGGGGASESSADRDYWLWPLPPAGQLKVVCQWLMLGIEPTTHVIDADQIAAAAARAAPIWPVR